MKFLDLKGKKVGKDISKYNRTRSKRNISKGQTKLGNILEEIYPNIPIYEEVPCVGTKLRLDYFIPTLRLAFEYDAKQHEEFNIFFHKTKRRFQRHKDRDFEKQEWCNINNIILVRINKEQLSKELVAKSIREQYDS